jgi:hypothetical protein
VVLFILKGILTKYKLNSYILNCCKISTFSDSKEYINTSSSNVLFLVLFEELRNILLTCIPPPANVTNMFGNWLNGIEIHSEAWIRIGTCALTWAIWNVGKPLF